MKLGIFFPYLAILTTALLVASTIATKKGTNKDPKKSKKSQRKPEFATVRFAGIKFEADADPVKVVQATSKEEADIVAILDCTSSDKAAEYQKAFKERSFSNILYKKNAILATRQESQEIGNYLIYKMSNGRRFVLRASTKAPPSEHSDTFKKAAKELKDQDPDSVVFYMDNNKVIINTPTYWKDALKAKEEKSIAKGKAKALYADAQLPDAGIKLCVISPTMGSALPWWAWLLIIAGVPLIVGVIALIVITIKSKKVATTAAANIRQL